MRDMNNTVIFKGDNLRIEAHGAIPNLTGNAVVIAIDDENNLVTVKHTMNQDTDEEISENWDCNPEFTEILTK
jgi:hypothetical protein